MDDIRLKISKIRHTQLITDPFPTAEDKNTNIYAAYQKGYEKAYQEIIHGLCKDEELNEVLSRSMETAYEKLIEDVSTGLRNIIDEENNGIS
jgi:hypothetical protein